MIDDNNNSMLNYMYEDGKHTYDGGVIKWVNGIN